jgi:protein TonB
MRTMSYANHGAGRERIVAIGLVGLVQGGIIAALMSGLAVQFIDKFTDKPLVTYPVPVDVPPPPPVERKLVDAPTKPIVTRTVLPLPDRDTPTVEVSQPRVPLTGADIPMPPRVDPMPLPTIPSPTPTPADLSRGASARGNVGAWFPQDAYPAQALRAGAEGRASVLLSVSPTGKVTDCRIVSGTGNAALDAATCRLAIRNGRFEPARDAAGNPVATQMRLPPVVWRIVN